jgi:DNA-binding FrmR family transcriptional regulator
VNARDKSEISTRLKRIGGQIAGIQRMLDDGRPLIDVLTQLSAVRAAIASASNVVLASHVEERTAEALASPSVRERRELVSEIVRLLEKRDA